jgi:hypothetical protein
MNKCRLHARIVNYINLVKENALAKKYLLWEINNYTFDKKNHLTSAEEEELIDLYNKYFSATNADDMQHALESKLMTPSIYKMLDVILPG